MLMHMWWKILNSFSYINVIFVWDFNNQISFIMCTSICSCSVICMDIALNISVHKLHIYIPITHNNGTI